MIVDAREAGFSPFGGVNIAVKAIGGISTLHVPEELKNAVKNKPMSPRTPPKDGWEIVDIVKQEPAIDEHEINTSKGVYVVQVVGDPVMASRNLNYKTEFGEPIYWLHWVYKISWKPKKR